MSRSARFSRFSWGRFRPLGGGHFIHKAVLCDRDGRDLIVPCKRKYRAASLALGALAHGGLGEPVHRPAFTTLRRHELTSTCDPRAVRLSGYARRKPPRNDRARGARPTSGHLTARPLPSARQRVPSVRLLKARSAGPHRPVARRFATRAAPGGGSPTNHNRRRHGDLQRGLSLGDSCVASAPQLRT